MFRAVKQAKHHGRHYNYRVYEAIPCDSCGPPTHYRSYHPENDVTEKNLGLYAANTPTTLVAINHPSGAEIERPYMLPIDGDVNFVMGPAPIIEEHREDCRCGGCLDF